MLNKNARKWVKALKSGKYKQGRNKLKVGDKFCCLGVACDLYAKEYPSAKWKRSHFQGQNQFLPDSVRNWLGLRDGGGRMPFRLYSLTDLNDGIKADGDSEGVKRHSFKEIAKFISSKPDGLFGKAPV